MDQVLRGNKDFRFGPPVSAQGAQFLVRGFSPHCSSARGTSAHDFCKEQLHEVGRRRGAWGWKSFDCLLRPCTGRHPLVLCLTAELASYSSRAVKTGRKSMGRWRCSHETGRKSMEDDGAASWDGEKRRSKTPPPPPLPQAEEGSTVGTSAP